MRRERKIRGRLEERRREKERGEEREVKDKRKRIE